MVDGFSDTDREETDSAGGVAHPDKIGIIKRIIPSCGFRYFIVITFRLPSV
jgi:hypothetical protein